MHFAIEFSIIFRKFQLNEYSLTILALNGSHFIFIFLEWFLWLSVQHAHSTVQQITTEHWQKCSVARTFNYTAFSFSMNNNRNKNEQSQYLNHYDMKTRWKKSITPRLKFVKNSSSENSVKKKSGKLFIEFLSNFSTFLHRSSLVILRLCFNILGRNRLQCLILRKNT